MTDDASIARVLFEADEIARAVDRLAARIAGDFCGKPLLVLGVLKGALYVTVDLVRALSRLPERPDPIEVEYLAVSSYGRSSRSSGEVRLLKDASGEISGKNVLVVEDILDNGLTLQYLQALLNGRGPAVLRTCVLFDKPYRRQSEVPVDYVGMVAPDEFVVGYGLDYAERYRNLPYVANLEPWVIST